MGNSESATIVLSMNTHHFKFPWMHPCSISNNTSEFRAGNVFCVIKFFTIDNKLFWLKFGMSFIESSGQTCISVLPMLNPSKNTFETQKAAGAPSAFHDYENVALSLCCWLAELPLFAPFFHFNSIHWQLTKSCCFHGRSPVGFQQTDSRVVFFHGLRISPLAEPAWWTIWWKLLRKTLPKLGLYKCPHNERLFH